jgi:uncharacterized membrane protein YozB (DUF420 family)
LLSEGFLGTEATGSADLVMVFEIGMGLALLIGAMLARRKQFWLHARCQTVIVLLNLVIIALWMVPSFHDHVSPKIPARLGQAYYGFATAHATLGGVAEIVALYILLAAGTDIVPQRFRLRNYKSWMRTALALWWLALVFGFATYARWYIPGLFRK